MRMILTLLSRDPAYSMNRVCAEALTLTLIPEQNVLRLSAKSVGDGTILSAATIATSELFASGRYEIKARFPAVKGLVLAMWTYHYGAMTDVVINVT